MTANIVLTIIGSSALFSFIEYLISRHDRKKEAKKEAEENPLNEAVRALLRDRIKHLAGCYIKRGWLSTTDLENITALYSAYKKLGGNSFIDELHKTMIEKCKLNNE